MPPVDLRGLYAVTPERADGARLLAEVDAALQGGCRILQFRDKINPMPERVTRARALRELTLRHGARLLINDDIALCMLIGADAVFLAVSGAQHGFSGNGTQFGQSDAHWVGKQYLIAPGAMLPVESSACAVGCAILIDRFKGKTGVDRKIMPLLPFRERHQLRAGAGREQQGGQQAEYPLNQGANFFRVSCRVALSGCFLSALCHMARASACLPDFHSTSPRCAAISGSALIA